MLYGEQVTAEKQVNDIWPPEHTVVEVYGFVTVLAPLHITRVNFKIKIF